MVVDTGYLALCLALVAAGYAGVASLLGGRRHHEPLIRSGEQALLGFAGLLTVAIAALWYALLSHDFQVQYVAENTSRTMPTLYTVAALWGGQGGSLLFWNWILALYGVAVVLTNRHRHRPLMPYVVVALACTGFFFAVVHLFAADPFKRLPFVPADGRGLNPLLQHPLMAIHPPLLYLGMVGMVVPYGFAMAALAAGRLDNTWLGPARRWMMIPWAFLGAGLLLGGKWAYVVLGWGGYWGWDPVENSSLMPWLAGTAFLHSIMVQERKGMLKRWNMALAILTYALCILGTFLTRSGVISSVHAFAQSNVGPFFAAFLILLTSVSALLLAARAANLKAEVRLESLASRETAFLLNNWVLLGILFAVLWGTIFPLISETLSGTKVTVGPPFFNQVNIPIGLVLLLLTGIGPLFAWSRTSWEGLRRGFTAPLAAGVVALAVLLAVGVRDPWALISLALCALVAGSILGEYHRGARARQRTTGERYLATLYWLASRYRRRYGGYLVHLGLVLLFAGFTGKTFTEEREFILARGASEQVRDFTLRYEGLSHHEDENMAADTAVLSLSRAGEFLATLLPERRFYRAFEQGTTEVSIYSTLARDVYLILVGYTEAGESAKFQVFINPLVNCVWLGGLILVLGSLWTLWPTARERRLARLERTVGRARQGTGTPLPPARG